MAKATDTMLGTFMSQFREKHGFILYRRIPFASIRRSGEKTYMVSSDERDQFIANFAAQAPTVLRRMAFDFFLAMFSLFVSINFIGFLGKNLEVALFLIHLVAIFVIENRRLKRIWDAPLRALAMRPPSPIEIEDTRWRTKPVSEYSKSELIVGIGMGLIGLSSATHLLLAPVAPGVDPAFFYGVLCLMAFFAVLGIMCIAEGYRRIMKPVRK